MTNKKNGVFITFIECPRPVQHPSARIQRLGHVHYDVSSRSLPSLSLLVFTTSISCCSQEVGVRRSEMSSMKGEERKRDERGEDRRREDRRREEREEERGILFLV
jgi:hypothetical protein